MINAFRVIWKSIKDLWEDMLILVLMNVVSILCVIPLVVVYYIAILFTAVSPLWLVIGFVVGIPASIPFAGAWMALHAVCNRTANGFAISWDNYWTAFKQDLIKSWKYTIFFMIMTAILIGDFFLWPTVLRPYVGEQTWIIAWVQGAWLAAGLFWLAIQLYVYPFFIEQETKSWRTALRNSALIAGANPLFTLLVLIVAVVLLGACLYITPLFVVIGLLIWVIIGTEAVANRIATYRKRLQDGTEKKTKSNISTE